MQIHVNNMSDKQCNLSIFRKLRLKAKQIISIGEATMKKWT